MLSGGTPTPWAALRADETVRTAPRGGDRIPLLSWARERSRWPRAAFSEFFDLAGVRWHVQRSAPASDVFLVHGSGASTHSWTAVLDELPETVTWMAADLPGHGFSTASRGTVSLAGPIAIGDALVELLRRTETKPRVIVGHSAGAAIALHVASRVGARSVLALNPSLVDALDTRVERAVAELVGPLVRSDAAGRVAAMLSRRTRLPDRLLDQTGSDVPEWSRRCYRTLFGDADHVSAVLRLFSTWSVPDTRAALAAFDGHLTTIVGREDEWIRTSDVRSALASVGRHEVHVETGGHLLHEERPTTVRAALMGALAASGA